MSKKRNVYTVSTRKKVLLLLVLCMAMQSLSLFAHAEMQPAPIPGVSTSDSSQGDSGGDSLPELPQNDLPENTGGESDEAETPVSNEPDSDDGSDPADNGEKTHTPSLPETPAAPSSLSAEKVYDFTDVEDERDDLLRTDEETEEKTEEEDGPTYIETVEIATGDDLYAFAKRVNSGDPMKDVLVVLTADIELDTKTQWEPIGKSVTSPFAGTFDGGGHSVSGIKLDEDVEGGLFGYLYEATISNLFLRSIDAPNSVNGMYFLATRTTIQDCKKKWGPFGILSTGISLFAAPTFALAWNGTADTSIPTTPNTIIVSTAEELAGIASLNESGTSFLGKTVVLAANLNLNGGSHNWIPIGSASKPFQGDFYGLNNIVADMRVTASGGLFGNLANGSVSNLIIDNANVTGVNTGIVAAASTTSPITGIVVKDSVISATQAAGICHQLGESSGSNAYPASITQCVVMNTTITGTTAASGIVHSNRNYAVTQCAVYRSNLSATNTNGIAYQSECANGSYSGINQHVVLGATFSGNARGIINSISNWNSTGHSFISDVSMPASGFLATSANPYGVEYFLTDSRLTNNLVTTSPLDYVTNCTWDSSTLQGTRSALSAAYGHAAYTTSYLTSGGWMPHDTFWDTQPDYYPYLKFLLSSQTPYMADIAGLASVAVLLDNPEETLSRAKEIRLVRTTPSGATVKWYDGPGDTFSSSWNEVNASLGVEVENRGNSMVITTKNDITLDLHAVVKTDDGEILVKNFGNATLLDNYLIEDVSARRPNSSEKDDLSITFVPSLTFEEPIRINPDARDMIRLFIQRSGGKYLDKALAVDSTNVVISTVPGPAYKVEFPTLALRDGTSYLLQIPEGALEEVDSSNTPKSNYSEYMEMEFKTISSTVPVIKKVDTQTYMTDNTITRSQIEALISVSEYPGGAPTPQPTPNAVTDPKVTLSELTTGVYYYVDPSILGSSRPVGTSVVHIFVVTPQGKSVRSSFVIEIEDYPKWESDPPAVVHINWTDNQNAVKALVLNGARAGSTTSRGGRRNVAIDVDFDSTQWNAAMAAPDQPAWVTATLYMLDQQGNRITSDPKSTRVYLDKVLRYDFNTSPIRIQWEDRTLSEWKREIESEIAFRALNFASTADVQFDHGKNNYDENKVYTVDMHTAKQVVTLCDGDPNSAYPCSLDEHKHLKDQVELQFSVKIVNVSLPEERAFWEKVENELFENEYPEFNTSAQRQPSLVIPDDFPDLEADNFFEMPISIIEALRVQPYNTLELSYSRFKWKFYGHALEPASTQQKTYPLAVEQRSLDDYLLRQKIGKDTPAVMLQFDYIGFLHGRVEFFYDLRLAGGLSQSEIENTDFYLYRYDRKTGRLTPVADVIVQPDGWASAVLTQLENTEYVFTDSRFGGEAYSRYIGYGAIDTPLDDDDEPNIELYYQGTNSFGADLAMFERVDPRSDAEGNPEQATVDLDDTIDPEQLGATGEQPSPFSEGRGVPVAVPIAAATVILIAGTAVLIVRHSKWKGA